MFSYVVRCSFVTQEAMREFLAWLRDVHVADVCAAGAEDGFLVVLDTADGESPALEARYTFASREAFDTYLRDHAPRLREDGKVVAERVGGVTFARTSGEIIDCRTTRVPS